VTWGFGLPEPVWYIHVHSEASMLEARGVVKTVRTVSATVEGYGREIPFGCVGAGLLSILHFLPGQAMAPHRHLDSDEYFSALSGDAEMLVNGDFVDLPQGHTFLRTRGTLHGLRNPGPGLLVVQSFQAPLPSDDATRWEHVAEWKPPAGRHCPRCWCGQIEEGRCLNCSGMCSQAGLDAHERHCRSAGLFVPREEMSN
jgi:mannose-6-phosphate isomerase-like protein (cupin superfamily)